MTDTFETWPIRSGTWHIGDNVDVLATLPDESVNLIVTSPPYDSLRSYNDGDAWTWAIFEQVAAQIARVLKPGGTIVWVVADATVKGSKTGSSFRQVIHFKDALGLNLHDTMIWNKGSFTAVGALQTRYAPVYEYMFILTKGKITTFNPIKDRKNKVSGKIGGNLRLADGSMRQMSSHGKERAQYGQRFAIWDIPPCGGNKSGHPAPFPISIAYDHIVSWSEPGDLVLDPFGGSGTTAVAAERTGRRWICIERDEDYSMQAIIRILGESTPSRP